MAAQEHIGNNTGGTDTHAIFIELKEPGLAHVSPSGNPLGPSGG